MGKRVYSDTFLKIFLPAIVVVSISIAVMTLLFSVFFEKNSVSVLTREYRKNLNMIRNLYTEVHFSVVPNALNLFDDPRIRHFLFAREFQYDIALTGLSEIDRNLALNKYVHSIYLYNSKIGYISSYKGFRDATHSSDPSLSALFESPDFRINTMQPRRVLFEGAEEPENVFSFIYGGLDEKTQKVKFAYVFNMSESKLRKMLIFDSPENESEFYIVNSDGTYLSHPDPAQFNTPAPVNGVIRQILQKTESSGHEFVSGNNREKWLAVWSDQNEVGWRFLYLIPEKKIFSYLTSLKNILYFISVAVLIVSFSLLLVMSFRIQFLLEYEKKLVAYIQGVNELSDRRLMGKNWYIGLFCFDFLNGKEKTDKHSQFLRLRNWITTERKLLKNLTLCVQIADRIYCTLSPEPLVWFDTEFYALRKKSVTEFNSEVTCVYASQKCGFDEIPAFYEMLRNELLQTSMISQGLSRKIRSTPEMAANRKIPAEFDFSRFSLALKSQNKEKITAEIVLLERYLTEKKDYFLFKTSATQAGLLAAQIFGKNLDPYLAGGMDGWRNSLFECERISGFTALLHALAQAADIFSELQIGSNSAKLTRYMKNYIIDNVQDKNLNSALVSEMLGLSLNYAREVFRKSEKMSINDYIGLYRVELAKQYLAGTEKTVQEICDIVGFTNYSYFCTYFKKAEHVSPSEFRLNMRISK